MYYIDELEVNGSQLYRVPVEGLKELGLEDSEVARLTLMAKAKHHKAQVKAFCATMRATIAGHADAVQVSAWNDKTQRAVRVAAGSPTKADTDILKSECTHRGLGETPKQLAAKQSKKSLAMAKNMSLIDGVQSATSKQLDTLTELEMDTAVIQMKKNLKALLAV